MHAATLTAQANRFNRQALERPGEGAIKERIPTQLATFHRALRVLPTESADAPYLIFLRTYISSFRFHPCKLRMQPHLTCYHENRHYLCPNSGMTNYKSFYSMWNDPSVAPNFRMTTTLN